MKHCFCGSALLAKDPKHLAHFVFKSSKEHNNFLSSKCNGTRLLLNDNFGLDYATSFAKIHESFSNPRSSSVFGIRRNLIDTSIQAEALKKTIAKNGETPVPKVCRATNQPEKDLDRQRAPQCRRLCHILSVKRY